MWEMIPDINWAGFYFRKGHWLVLGRFDEADARGIESLAKYWVTCGDEM